MTGCAIVFDLDGTLTDSGAGIINCVELTLKHYGIQVENRNELYAFVGPPLRDTFQQFGIPADEVENAIKIYRNRYLTTGIYENTPYPGISKLLQTLKTDGYQLFIATSKPETSAKLVLDYFGMSKFFDMICGATWDGSRDSKESVITYLLSQSGNTERFIMIGDTHFDVLGAAAHGIPTIGVSWGYGKSEDMLQAGAVAIANTAEELLRLIHLKSNW